MRLSIFIVIFMWASAAWGSTAQIEKYLSELKTMTADFKQIDPHGTISTGKFQLKRPSKMRWQYNPPTPILMITNGKYLTYYDYDLNQVSDIPLDDTLLSILTKQDVDFENSNITVIENYEENGFITITMEQKDAPENGSLGMVFSKKPMQLQHLIVKDATNQVTQISLNNIKQGVSLADEVFYFKDPRIGGKRKKYDRVNGK